MTIRRPKSAYLTYLLHTFGRMTNLRAVCVSGFANAHTTIFDKWVTNAGFGPTILVEPVFDMSFGYFCASRRMEALSQT